MTRKKRNLSIAGKYAEWRYAALPRKTNRHLMIGFLASAIALLFLGETGLALCMLVPAFVFYVGMGYAELLSDTKNENLSWIALHAKWRSELGKLGSPTWGVALISILAIGLFLLLGSFSFFNDLGSEELLRQRTQKVHAVSAA